MVNNFNYGRFVEAAVESALDQTHPKVSVIAVDDGSTDDSHEILRRYEGRVDLVFKPNGGQASAINAGFARCSGDVVIFLDADDVLLPNAAALAASAFAADPSVVKSQCRMELIDRDGRRTGVIKPPLHLPVPSGDVCRAELTFPFDLVWLPMSANAFRSDVLRRILPVPEEDYPVCGADWYLVHLAPLFGTVYSLEEVGACYRVHGSNRYEPREPVLDLEHVRHGLVHAEATTRALTRLSDELNIRRPYPRILSVADLSNRLVSLKLEPRLHPIASDRVWRLALDGNRAANRRSEVAWPMRALFVGWFWTMAIAPRPFAQRLAPVFLFPERRRALNRVLARLQKPNRSSIRQASPDGNPATPASAGDRPDAVREASSD